MLEMPPTHVQGKAYLLQFHRSPFDSQPIGQSTDALLEPFRRLCRHGNEVGRFLNDIDKLTGTPFRRLFNYEMTVRAAEPEGTNSRTPRLARSGRPILQSRVDEEWAILEVDVGIGVPKVERGRYTPLLQSQQHLDDRTDARGGHGMADVRLH